MPSSQGMAADRLRRLGGRAYQLARATPSPGQWSVLGVAEMRRAGLSGERRLLLGQATKTIFKVYLGGALRAQLGELSLKIPNPGAKKRHLIEEPVVRSRCNITEQGLGHLKGLHGQTCARHGAARARTQGRNRLEIPPLEWRSHKRV